MSSRTRILGFAAAGALALVVGVVYLAARPGEQRTPRALDVAPASLPGEPADASAPAQQDLADAAPANRQRSEAEAPAAAPIAAAPAPTTPASARALGRVLDLGGNPVAGVAVALRSKLDEPLATTAADGSFAFDAFAGREPGLTVADPRWYTLRDTEPLQRESGTETLVVVAPAIAVGGRVQDASGAPIEDARVRLELPWSVFAPFPIPLDRGRDARETETRSRGDGTFELSIPSAARARLAAEATGHADASIPAPLDARADLVLTLASKKGTGSTRIEGVVVHADGSPGVDATVRYGSATSQADALGRFALTVEPGGAATDPLVALKRGFQAAVVPDFAAVIDAAVGAVPFQRLVLGGPPLAIEGRVVDHEGRPKKGWIVQPVDPVILVDGTIPPECAESVARGEPVRATTDAEGAFALEGLQDRAYRLQAHSAEELVRVESGPIQAGARNARLVVPADAVFAKVTGVVVSADGTPVPGVEVRAALVVFRTKWGYTMEHSREALTDAAGKFELANVPRKDSKLDAGGDRILPTSAQLDDYAEGQLLRIVAARRCHVRVEGVPASANLKYVEVQDANGSSLQLMQFQSGGWMSSSQVELVEGGSPLFAVSDAARTIVFRGQDEQEVSRALVLAPSGITVVRW